MANEELNEYMGTEDAQKIIDEYTKQFEGIPGEKVLERVDRYYQGLVASAYIMGRLDERNQ